MTVTKGDYTVDFLTSAMKGQDVVVLTIGSAALAAQTTAIDAAIKAGVKRIIPSEFGSVSGFETVLQMCTQ